MSEVRPRAARFAAAGAAALLAAAALFWAAVDPKLELAEKYPGGAVLRDRAGRVMRVTLGAGDLDSRPYYCADPEDWIVKALVAAEDARFWNHRGVDFLSAARAAVQNVRSLRTVSGASTITMQASRLFAPHPKSLFWKGVEAVRALKIERVRSKRWVLSQYLNRAPFGSNLVGVEAAAQGWFGKTAKELSASEAALLAGMVQRPTHLRPDRNLERALRRRAWVLGRMRELEMIGEEQFGAAMAARPQFKRSPRPFAEPFYCDWAAAQLGAAGGDCRTALDPEMQDKLRRAVERAAANGYSAAAVALRVETAEVEALCCSGDYFSKNAGQVNTALAARPAGSTLKPLLMALAMDRGVVAPDEILDDVPRAYGDYRPANFDNSYRGRVRAADALVLSLNLPFVEMLRRVGVGEFGAALRALGMRHMTAPDASYGLGMAIGNVPVSLVELVGAYGCIARGGAWLRPCAVAGGGGAGARIFSEGACRLISEMLSGPQRSAAALGHEADVRTSRFAWKTGTSAGFRDAWTVLWNPQYVIGVWCGHKSGNFGDGRIVGAAAAAPVAWEIARSIYPRHDGPWFAPCEEVVEREICAESGMPAAARCPRRAAGRAIRGRSSPELCALHGGAAARRGAAARLEIVRPAHGSEFKLLPGMPGQSIVFKAAGARRGQRLWWFVDGAPAGETAGPHDFVWRLEPGRHAVTCAAADGTSASVGFTVGELE